MYTTRTLVQQPTPFRTRSHLEFLTSQFPTYTGNWPVVADPVLTSAWNKYVLSKPDLTTRILSFAAPTMSVTADQMREIREEMLKLMASPTIVRDVDTSNIREKYVEFLTANVNSPDDISDRFDQWMSEIDEREVRVALAKVRAAHRNIYKRYKSWPLANQAMQEQLDIFNPTSLEFMKWASEFKKVFSGGGRKAKARKKAPQARPPSTTPRVAAEDEKEERAKKTSKKKKK